MGDYDIEIVADETYGPDDADMTVQLTRIRNTAGVETVVVADFGQGPAIVTRNYAQLGIDLPMYQSHGVASDAFIGLAGDAAEGVRLPGTALLIADILPEADPQREVVQAYKAAYVERFGEEPSTFAGYAYDAFQLLVNAIREAGSSDPAAIRDALEQTSGYVGVTGEFKHVAGRPHGPRSLGFPHARDPRRRVGPRRVSATA